MAGTVNHNTEGLIPLVEASMDAGLTYPRLLRLITLRLVRGARIQGRWYADPDDARRWVAENGGSPAQEPAAR